MSDLFTSANRARPKPLAASARPASLAEIVGQRHIIGPGKPLRRRVDADQIGTVILFGPPGVGKTSIAQAIGAQTGKEFHQLHPAQHKVEDIRKVAEIARDKSVLVFIDEIHRYSATVQDNLLALTEEGVFDLIGATTGNPYHVLTNALVSRATILRLEPLTVEEMEEVIERAIAHISRQGVDVEVSDGAMRQMAARAGGDARRAVNTMETLTVGAKRGDTVTITEKEVEEVYEASPIMHDRGSDMHYDVVSAFIKSMRGSDPDATLYWLARLIHGGEPAEFIARRLIIHASEDVGLADNTALQTAVAALEAVRHVGYPEARIVLAHAALHIARAPKSNSAYRGIAAALDHVQREAPIPVPPHLRDTHYKGAAALGHVGYDFPHDRPEGWSAQDLAPGISPGTFYESDGRGGQSFEARADAYWQGVTGRDVPRRFA